MDRNNHFMYVLECADGTFYAGYSTDVGKRVLTHNSGKGAKYTRPRLPVTCIYYESFQSKREALQEEYAFKQLTRKQKEQYLHNKVGQQHVEAKKL
ncbi:GIY-YIG nuclease family protein [Bacillus carboniphilus]|uniref:GIY-YIG nuclease family protein n=1 Tax=Bacillus carboniphilus TaxID=86663 RepID=A0ABN0VZ30_9BACI